MVEAGVIRARTVVRMQAVVGAEAMEEGEAEMAAGAARTGDGGVDLLRPGLRLAAKRSRRRGSAATARSSAT